MLILDTDHLVEYQRGSSAAAQRLKKRLDESDEPYATSIITVEEVMRGWLAAIRRTQDPRRQVSLYAKLRQLFRFFATWDVAQWTEESAAHFIELRALKIRVGSMDLKIASNALAHNAKLLTRNRRDFENVPGLEVLDWLS